MEASLDMIVLHSSGFVKPDMQSPLWQINTDWCLSNASTGKNPPKATWVEPDEYMTTSECNDCVSISMSRKRAEK